MAGMQAHILADGRLHLHHGPIDLIIGAFGRARLTAFQRARNRFDGLLQELVDELAELRKPLDQSPQVNGVIARNMLAAIQPFAGQFVTPMAAVAGAVADEVLARMIVPDIDRIYINNGGDISVYLAENQEFSGAIQALGNGRITLKADEPWRGIATSGWRGRSHSLGIADSVTVIAKTATMADVAATMIANKVNLPDHPAIQRRPAVELMPDSDLGQLGVTVGVVPLLMMDKYTALERGRKYAENLRQNGLIGGALLTLQGEMQHVGECGFRLGVSGEKEHV